MGAETPIRDPYESRDRLAAEQQRERINAFYSNLQIKSQGVGRDIDALLSALGFAEATPFTEDAPGVLDAEVENKCKNYFFEHVDGPAREAIRARDLMGLRKLLGPGLYALEQKYSRETRANHWGWLKVKCQLEVERLKAKIYIEFAQENGFPQSLNPQQKIDLKQKMLEKLDEIKNKGTQPLIAPWVLEAALKETVIRHLKLLLQQEIIAINETSCSDLSSTLYAQKERWQLLLQRGQAFLSEQSRSHDSHDALNSAAHLRQLWSEFHAKFFNPESDSERRRIDSEYERLYASELPKLGLAHEFAWQASRSTVPQTLFDYAFTEYVSSTNQTDKNRLLALMETLLQFGAKPSPNLFLRSMNWTMLSLLLKHLATETQVGEETRASLAVYSEETRGTLVHWLTRHLVNVGTKESRRVDVQVFTKILCAPQQGVDVDRRLIARVVERRAQAPRGPLQRSALYDVGLGPLLKREVDVQHMQVVVHNGSAMPRSQSQSTERRGAPGSVVRPVPVRLSRTSVTGRGTFLAAPRPSLTAKRDAEEKDSLETDEIDTYKL